MPRLQSILALGLLTLAPAFGPAPRAVVAADAAPAAVAGHAAPATGGGHEANPNILEPQSPLAIYTVVVFLLLLAVLWRFAWGPLSQALHRREEQMRHTLEESERARQESARLLAQHSQQMAQAAEQARALEAEIRRKAEAAAEQLIQKAQAEAEAARKRAEREIGTARDQALAEIWTKTADLAVSVAGRVLARDLGPEDHHRLVQVALHELPDRPAAANGQGGHTA
ncbi:MAG TPA: F0F1 ATP synthase subunit B [Isosphaeraceae bacterium]|jgi:F-type H+-transporting ATPase subunit b